MTRERFNFFKIKKRSDKCQHVQFCTSSLSMLIIFFLIVSQHHALCSIIFSKADVNNILYDYSIQSTYIPNLHLKRHIRNSSVCHRLTLNIASTDYDLCIKIFKLSYPGLINETTQIFTPRTNTSTSIEGLSLKMVGGHVVGLKDLSSIKGYLHEDRFYGKIQMGREAYYVEPAKHFDVSAADSKSDSAIIYKKPNSSFFDEINGTFSFGFEIFDINMGINLGRPQKVNGFDW